MDLDIRVIAWLAQQGVDAYLVGGCVRDRLLGRPVYDLDVSVVGDGLALARRLADHFQGAYYPLDMARGTGRALLPTQGDRHLMVDVARFRGPDLVADLADRDFTINALAVDVQAPNDVIDHHAGLADLQAGLIRPVSQAIIRNDPLRALRAVRQAGQLGFALAPETEALIRRDGVALGRVSGERIRDEFTRLLALAHSASQLDTLDELGLLTIILPELEPLRQLAQAPPHYLDALAHSLETVRALEEILASLGPNQGKGAGNDEQETPMTPFAEADSRLTRLVPFAGRLHAHLDEIVGGERPRKVTLKLAALLHDVGKPEVRTVDDQGRIRFIGHQAKGARVAAGALRRLRFNNAEVRLGETIIQHHMRPLLLAGQKSVSSRAIYRFFRATRDAGVDVLLHALADHRATYTGDGEDDGWSRLVALTARMMADYWERQAERIAPPPLLDGHDLLREFGLQPGPYIGELLEAVREAQVVGQVRSREEALALVRGLLADRDKG